MRQGLLILFILTTSISFGQNDFNAVTVADSIKKSGVDTFFIYHSYCRGCSRGATIERNTGKIVDCVGEEHLFVFYLTKGQKYIKKSTTCNRYKSLHIDTAEVFSFFIKNFDQMQKEKIFDNATLSDKGDTLYMYMDDTGLTSMYLSLGKKTKDITIDWYQLRDDNDLKEKNINYDRNNKTKIIRLTELAWTKAEGLVC